MITWVSFIVCKTGSLSQEYFFYNFPHLLSRLGCWFLAWTYLASEMTPCWAFQPGLSLYMPNVCGGEEGERSKTDEKLNAPTLDRRSCCLGVPFEAQGQVSSRTRALQILRSFRYPCKRAWRCKLKQLRAGRGLSRQQWGRRGFN